MNDGKKIKYNLIMGVAGQFLVLALGIVLPRLVITGYGSEVNGLLSSVTNIYAYIALLVKYLNCFIILFFIYF